MSRILTIISKRPFLKKGVTRCVWLLSILKDNETIEGDTDNFGLLGHSTTLISRHFRSKTGDFG